MRACEQKTQNGLEQEFMTTQTARRQGSGEKPKMVWGGRP